MVKITRKQKRPVLWGLAVGGQAGVELALGLLRLELDLAMALAGRPEVKAITGDLIRGGRRDLRR